MQNGALTLGSSSTNAAGAITNGPLGLGGLTLAGGIIRSDSTTARSVNNSLAITGSLTFGDATNNGTQTYDPTNITSPAQGSIQVGNAPVLTILSPVIFGGTGAGFAGITGTGGMTIRGPGTLTMINSGTASNFGTLTIGDGTSLGGNVSVNSQKALGTGPVVVNPYGTLTQTAAFTPSQAITVNAGGTYANTAAVTMPASTVVGSGASLTSSGGALALTSTCLPTAGYLLLNPTTAMNITGAYPALTGTLAFGGTGAQGATTSAAGNLSSSAGSSRTIAFNQTGGGAFTYNGLTLNADLTVAGSGNTGFTGLRPSGAAGNLGIVTAGGGPYALTVAMAPIGMASVTGSTTGWGLLRLVSGTMQVNTTDGLGTSLPAQLDGGNLRLGINLSRNVAVSGNGGALESDASARTYSGTLTGGAGSDTDLILRTLGGNLTLSGSSPAFTQGFTLASAGTPASILFTTNDTAIGDTSNNLIIVPRGVSFGFDTASRASALISRFTTDAESILDLQTATTVNVTAGGGNPLNRDLRIGLSGTAPTAMTISDGGTYKLAVLANTTISAANVLADIAGGSPENLDLSATAVISDANSSGTNVRGTATLTLSASQNFAGTTSVTGSIRNSLMGGGVAGPTLSLATAGELSATSAMTIDQGATFTLASGSNSGASGAALTVKGAGSINVNSASPLRDDLALTLGGTSGGGNYTSTAGGSQTLASLTIAPGISVVTPNATGVLTFSNPGGSVYARAAGGLVSFANANVSFTNQPTGSSTSIGADAETGGTILIGAYLATTKDLVQARSGAIAAPTYQTQNTLTSWGTAGNQGNILVNAAPTGSAPTAGINSLKIANAATYTISAANTLTLGSGMLVYSGGGVGSLTGGNLATSNASGLTVVSAGTNLLTVGTSISGNPAVTFYTPQRMSLTGGNAMGDITIINTAYSSGGHLRADASSYLGGTGTNLNLHGGILHTNGNISTDRNVVVGPLGGGFQFEAGAASITANGTISVNGTLNLSASFASSTGVFTLNGAISGPGMINHVTGTLTNGRLILAGDNHAWSGGLNYADGMQVRLANAAAAGSGPLVNVQNIGILQFTSGFGAGAQTLANSIVGSSTSSKTLIANCKTDGPVTMSGQIASSGGLAFQGYDTGSGQVSETVLAGSVAVAGTPNVYSFGNASSAQRFINGQGGISLGVTGYQTTTALAFGTAGYLDMPTGGGGSNVQVTNGAEGYVRFTGPGSFIPGAVGPGYLSALRLGGAASRTFGWLVSGSAGGTSYSLPQGKAFVIGTLGSGTAQTGTLGATGSGANTATLLGGAKHAAGQLLAGFYGGDVNIHANTSTDSASLNLSAVQVADALVLGNGTNPVVFCPTWGDSGATSNLTLMQKRTGGTTLTKVGAGTLAIIDADYIHTDGTSARSGFTWNVTGGTLRYEKDDGAGANFAGFAVGSGCSLSGSGKINGAVTVTSGTVSPGNGGPGKLTVGSVAFNSSAATFAVDLNGSAAGSGYDQLVVSSGGTVNLANASLGGSLGYGPAIGTTFTIIDNQGSNAISGTFNGLAQGSTVSIGGSTFTISYIGGDGNDVTLKMSSGNTSPAQVTLSTPVNAVAGQEATNGRTLNTRPALIWNVPADVNSDTLHFQVFLDAVDGSTLVADSEVPAQRSAFSWYNGSAWVAMPAGGATASTGQVRWIPPTPLAVGNPFWKVRAYDGSAYGLASAVQRFIIGTRTWTDATLVAGARIRRIHLEELREEIDYARRFRNLNTACVTADPVITPNVTAIRAVHRNELNAGLRAIDAVTGLSGASTLVDAVPGGAIRVQDFTTLRTVLTGM